MSDIQIQNQNNEIIIKDNEDIKPKNIEEKNTILDSLLDEKSFTSIENLKSIDNDDTITNNSYITDVDGKKTTFLDLIKNNVSDVDSNNESDAQDKEDNDSVKTERVASKNFLQVNHHYRVDSIDDTENDLIYSLVNNKFLKRIQSNDSLELKHKSITKLENLDDLSKIMDSSLNPGKDSRNNIKSNYIDDEVYTDNNIDDFKNSVNSSLEFHSLDNVNNPSNNINNNDVTINKNNIISKNIEETFSYKPVKKGHKKDSSSVNFTTPILNRSLCNDSLDLDSIFDKKGTSTNVKYNTISKCTCLDKEDIIKNKNFSNHSLNTILNGSTGIILKSSLKKISMFSSEYSQMPKKDNHVIISDSVTIINRIDDDKRKSLRKSALRAFKKSFSANPEKHTSKTINQNSRLGEVFITTELLNDIENPNKFNAPKAEDNRPSKVDKIINHCRRLSFSKMGKNENNENNKTNTDSNNSNNSNNVGDYRKDIEKLRKKYALVEEKPKSKYLTLMKLLDINKPEEEFLSLTSLEVYYKNIDALPNEIGDMINLRFLYLNDNRITSIPPDIGKLVNLIHLDFSYNSLTSIPKEIGNLKNLKKLILTGNKIKELPEEIGSMTELKILSLQNNQLTSIPDTIVKLTNLSELHLSKNKIKKLPEIFDEMRKRCKIKL